MFFELLIYIGMVVIAASLVTLFTFVYPIRLPGAIFAPSKLLNRKPKAAVSKSANSNLKNNTAVQKKTLTRSNEQSTSHTQKGSYPKSNVINLENNPYILRKQQEDLKKSR